MKKKILSMLIILVLALSLCACGKSSDEFDKEEYIANAKTVDVEELCDAVMENAAKAEMTYGGNQYKMTLTPEDIEENRFRCWYFPSNGGSRSLFVYMETEDLAKLEVESEVTIVGTVEITGDFLQINNAFIVE